MSRPYRIVVQRVVEEEIQAADQSTLRLNLDPILGEERSAEILAGVLQRNGWREVGEGVYEKDRGDGETMACDLAEREVTTTVVIERQLREEVRKEIRGDTWNRREMREMTEAEIEDLRRREEAGMAASVSAERRQGVEEELRQEVAERLTASADERRREVNRLILEAASEALKEKAAELGNVERVDEAWHGDDYELTIAISE